MNVRSTVSTHAPTGRAASNHELAATTTARPSSTSAIPSRRCPGLDVAGPPDRPRRAAGALGRHHPGRAHGPAAGRARQRPATTGCAAWRAWLAAWRAGPVARRAGGLRGSRTSADPEVAFDLLVRVPERAAVLLAMTASLVATTSSAPPATLVTQLSGEPSDRLDGGTVSRVTTGEKQQCRCTTSRARLRSTRPSRQEAPACPSSSSPR